MPTAVIAGGRPGSAERWPSCCTPAATRSRSPDRIPNVLTESDPDAMRSKIPFKRSGISREVAEAVAFLASDAAGCITGQDITVAGGYGLGA